jgi:hypothetical protein
MAKQSIYRRSVSIHLETHAPSLKQLELLPVVKTLILSLAICAEYMLTSLPIPEFPRMMLL